MRDSIALLFVPDARYCRHKLLGLTGGLGWDVSVPSPLVRQCEVDPSRLLMYMSVAQNLSRWGGMLSHSVAGEEMKGRERVGKGKGGRRERVVIHRGRGYDGRGA